MQREFDRRPSVSTRRHWAGFLLYWAMSIGIAAGAFAAGYGTHMMQAPPAAPGSTLLAEVRRVLDSSFLGELPAESTLERGAAQGYVTAVGDPYTIFLNPPAQELETQSLQGEFGGIGATLSRNEAGEVVLTPIPDLPAALAGLLAGDVLVAVDGEAITAAMPLEEVTALVRGPVGTEVTLTVRRGADPPRVITLTRQVIELPSVAWRVIEKDPTIGVLAVSRFSEKTPAETRRAIDALRAEGVRRIVLDLRGNGGGLLSAAIETAGIFLDGGAIMYEVRRNEAQKEYTAPGRGPAADLPLAILVNHGTASAAEIVAGALRDRGRGPLIGQTTFGKGSVQLVFTLSDNSSMHVTNARWYTPSRAAIDQVGLQPDIELQPGTNGADPELDRAIEFLQTSP